MNSPNTFSNWKKYRQRLTTLKYQRLDDLVTAIGLPRELTADTLAGERIESMLTTAPRERHRDRGIEGGHRERLVRRPPLGTEDVYKLYAERFLGADHLRRLQEDAKALVARAFFSLDRAVSS